MRAWQVSGAGEPAAVLHMVDIDLPVPGPGEVRVRVHAAALGLPDVFMCRSSYPLTPALPFVPGQEMCGTVDAVGDGVELAVGTRVMGVTSFVDGHGGFAEMTLGRAATLFPVGDAMSDADAAAFRIGYSTAWIGLVRRGGLQAGETLLVLGAAGGSGAAAVLLGRALGARVIAVVAGADKREYCSALGADVVVDRLVDQVADTVRAVTRGRGADVVYDPVGGDAAREALRVVARDGRFLAVGFASGRWVEVSASHAVRGSYSLVGVYAGGYTLDENQADQRALMSLVDRGDLGGFVTRVVPFDELPAALERLARGEAIGKTVLHVTS